MVEMARLKRTAERIREGVAERIAKSLEDSLAWKAEHSESGCTKGMLRKGMQTLVAFHSPRCGGYGGPEGQSAKLPLSAKMRNATPATTKSRIEMHTVRCTPMRYAP